jgi:peroxin-19
MQSATTEEDFMRTMNSFNDSGMQNDLMPFMHELMTSLMSKEMMYPSLKEMVEKVCYAGFVCCGGTHGVVQYPQWLNDNGERVSQDERKLYETQLTIMRQLVAEYESERADDSDDVRAKRFDTIMVLMQKVRCRLRQAAN